MRSAFAYPISSPNAFTKSPEEPDEDVLSRQLGMERNQQGMTSGPVVDASTGPCVEEHGAKTTSETATQAGTCSNRPQKRVYKRAYQKLQEETARIVKGLTRRHHSSDLLTQAKSKTPNRPREETKRSRAPSPMRPLTLCSTDFEYWDTLPTSQFEVELITKRDVRRDEYEYIDVPVGLNLSAEAIEAGIRPLLKVS
ncbi:hypothetical protein QQS21_002946 [Conoideocrella luteorostrata]|uniref:Uncharacterized protein n=1 Tax=Conoideocrella luteorostrata TaxID=1105319 RepID=A0AAJ0CWQ0_9HYPO|nr:hypothetical protein QQS21_002946 [Conoideocrella luteorostrata]